MVAACHRHAPPGSHRGCTPVRLDDGDFLVFAGTEIKRYSRSEGARHGHDLDHRQPAVPQLVVTSEFAAPRELLFRTYTDPDLLAQWLGPRGLTVTVDHLDPRHGGTWRCGADHDHYLAWPEVANDRHLDCQRP